jgi:hypothetical protein
LIPAGLLLVAATTAAPAATAFAQDLEIREPRRRGVAVLSNVRIAARVTGDVIVWGGDVTLDPEGSVDGNLSVFAGSLSTPPGKPPAVGGVVSTPGTLLRLYLDEMHRAPWPEAAPALLSRGLRLIALSAWLAVSLALLFLFSSPFARAAASAERDWTRTLLAGTLGVLTLLLATIAALALLPGAISVPLAIVFGALAVAAKIFGMSALFLLLGQKILRSVAPSRRPAALASGLAVLGLVSLVPFVGALVWSAASVLAVGIALLTRFGAPRYRVVVSG